MGPFVVCKAVFVDRVLDVWWVFDMAFGLGAVVSL
jgi:hypothetical protein